MVLECMRTKFLASWRQPVGQSSRLPYHKSSGSVMLPRTLKQVKGRGRERKRVADLDGWSGKATWLKLNIKAYSRASVLYGY